MASDFITIFVGMFIVWSLVQFFGIIFGVDESQPVSQKEYQEIEDRKKEASEKLIQESLMKIEQSKLKK